MPAYGYEFYLLVVNSILSSWPLEDKIHIHARACNILYISIDKPLELLLQTEYFSYNFWIIIFIVFWFQNWENQIASQMYMLIWIDFFLHILVSLVGTTIWK